MDDHRTIKGSGKLQRPFFLLLPLLFAGLCAGGASAGTLVVNTTGDAGDNNVGDGECSTGALIIISGLPLEFGPECTLRAAIEEANANAGADIIRFSSILPTTVGKVEIYPASPYPDITEALLIDGYSAWGYDIPDPDAVPVINIGGAFVSTAEAAGLVIASGADDTTLQGLAVFQFPGTSIFVNGASNVTIEGSHIGLNRGVFVRGSGYIGIHLDGSGPIVVGKTCDASSCTGKGNVIVASTIDGIFSRANNVSIAGNLIGTSPTGASTSIPFGGTTRNLIFGIEVAAGTNVQVGSDVAGGGNLVSGNLMGGIEVYADDVLVVGNKVGTNLAGTATLGNGGRGIRVFFAEDCEIRSNLVGGNTSSGIEVGGSGHRVVGNLVGTNEMGANLGNAATAGILVGASQVCDGCQIGDVGQGNVVGFHRAGIEVDTGFEISIPLIQIESNYVGTNAVGQDLGNESGVSMNSIGVVGSPNGLDNGLGNVIGFNTRAGIHVPGAAWIRGNYIGTNAAGEDLGNTGYGIEIEGSALVGGRPDEAMSEIISGANVVAYSDDSAIAVKHSSGVREFSIRGNTLYGNGGDAPIDLIFPLGAAAVGPTPNDLDDADLGVQNYPVFDVSETSIDPGTGNLEVRYLVDSLPANAAYPLEIDFYLIASPDGEADVWIGSDSYPLASASAYQTASVPAPPGSPLLGRVVATATAADFQTSELSTQFVPVPEPGLRMLLAAGASLLACIAPRRRIRSRTGEMRRFKES